MQTFAGIDPSFATFHQAQILLQSIPYDGTSTWGKGADLGFKAFLDSAVNMELYDIETRTEVFKKGIHILPEIVEQNNPEKVFVSIYKKTKELINYNKFLTFFGGEHSISIGIIKAFYEKYPTLTVLHIDAHADLRPSYEGTPYNHACAVYDASQHTNLIQVGIRSMHISEMEYLNPAKCYFMHQIASRDNWMDESIEKMTNPVYITLDLDALDPSIMPATGTPEPGGFGWYPLLKYLKMIFLEKKVIGFDLVELAPITGLSAPNFLAAKLYYKMLSYQFAHGK